MGIALPFVPALTKENASDEDKADASLIDGILNIALCLLGEG
ncbi:Uncharacterized protein EbC_25860 [Erwinia billingiae Eb661]|uniref:Uncharacterized protein n=1 Tax=Erwinia billingiae (strain Eb661) TaxID=634500 RepID=D8MTG0_ERWBE|nr:Uncharacterized protein EbC_25860 [Erwinia billingiae Eb661]